MMSNEVTEVEEVEGRGRRQEEQANDDLAFVTARMFSWLELSELAPPPQSETYYVSAVLFLALVTLAAFKRMNLTTRQYPGLNPV